MFNNKILLEVCRKSKDQASSGRFAACYFELLILYTCTH